MKKPHAALLLVNLGLIMGGYINTSLDTSTRLARFTLQELFSPRAGAGAAAAGAPARKHPVAACLANMYVATLLSVLVALWLTFGESDRIWPVFGASNQLLAALTLLVASLWLIRRRAKPLVAIIPMAIMLAVSGTALYQLAGRELRKGGNIPLGVICVVLLALAAVLAVMSARAVARELRKP